MTFSKQDHFKIDQFLDKTHQAYLERIKHEKSREKYIIHPSRLKSLKSSGYQRSQKGRICREIFNDFTDAHEDLSTWNISKIANINEPIVQIVNFKEELIILSDSSVYQYRMRKKSQNSIPNTIGKKQINSVENAHRKKQINSVENTHRKKLTNQLKTLPFKCLESPIHYHCDLSVDKDGNFINLTFLDFYKGVFIFHLFHKDTEYPIALPYGALKEVVTLSFFEKFRIFPKNSKLKIIDTKISSCRPSGVNFIFEVFSLSRDRQSIYNCLFGTYGNERVYFNGNFCFKQISLTSLTDTSKIANIRHSGETIPSHLVTWGKRRVCFIEFLETMTVDFFESRGILQVDHLVDISMAMVLCENSLYFINIVENIVMHSICLNSPVAMHFDMSYLKYVYILYGREMEVYDLPCREFQSEISLRGNMMKFAYTDSTVNTVIFYGKSGCIYAL